MNKIRFAFAILFLSLQVLPAEDDFFEDDSAAQISKREARYENTSKPSGWMSHRWSLKLNSDDKKFISIYMGRSQASEAAAPTHAVGLTAGQSFRHAGFQFGYSQGDRSFSEASALSQAYGMLRLSPMATVDLFARYGKTWRDLNPEEGDIDWGSFTTGLRLKASGAVSVQIVYAPEKRLKCGVTGRW